MSPLRLNQVFKDAKIDATSPLPTANDHNDNSSVRMRVKQDTLKKAMQSQDLIMTHEERLSKAQLDAYLNLTPSQEAILGSDENAKL